MQSLNVAYILLHFPYLTETFVAEEIRAIQAEGIDVHIISLLKPGPGLVQSLSQQLLPYTWYAPGLLAPRLWRAQIYFLFKSPRLYWSLLAALLRQPYPRQPPILLVKRLIVFFKAVAVAHYLQDTETQLLHAHFAALPGAAAGIITRLLGLPFTVTVHAFDIYCRVKNELLYLVTSQADHIIAISEYNRQHVAALGTCSAKAISVIHCGVNLAQFEEQHQRQTERSPSEPFSILSVGSLVPKKGHVHLIAACHLLQQRRFDFVCNIIGSGRNKLALEQHIQAYGLQNQVKILEYCPHPEIIAACRQHDLFVLASVIAREGDRDGIPVVLMEAGAVGMPIISTQVSGIPELIHHNETGWVTPPGDPAALADAIVTLAADPALRARLGQNARDFVRAEFDIKGSARLLATLFRTIYQQWQSGCGQHPTNDSKRPEVR